MDDEVNGKKIAPDNYRNFRIKMYLHNLANRLMNVLGDYPFVCCKSMLKAEAELVQEALEIINDDKKVTRPDDIDDDEWNGFNAERAFFRWYFSQLFNKDMQRENGKTPQNTFTEYAKNSLDEDAKMHSALMELRSCIRSFREDGDYGPSNKEFNELKQKYGELLKHTYSERVNKEIRTEYNKFKCIAEILIKYDPSSDRVSNRIINYAYPFLQGKDEKIEVLKSFVKNSYDFRKYYFIFPVQYTGSLEYQMADIEDLIVNENDIYDASKNESLSFDSGVEQLNTEFKKLIITGTEAESKKSKIIFVLYYEAGQCFEFRKKMDDGSFCPQKGFPMDQSIWNGLIKTNCDDLFHMFQYHKDLKEKYRSNPYLIGNNKQVAIIITINNEEIPKNNKKLKIELSNISEGYGTPQQDDGIKSHENEKLCLIDRSKLLKLKQSKEIDDKDKRMAQEYYLRCNECNKPTCEEKASIEEFINQYNKVDL